MRIKPAAKALKHDVFKEVTLEHMKQKHEHTLGDYWDLFLLKAKGMNKDFDLIPCPWHGYRDGIYEGKRDRSMKITGYDGFCMLCGHHASLESIKLKIKTERKMTFAKWCKQ